MVQVVCKQCGLVYDSEYVSKWDGGVFSDSGKLKQLKCAVCNTYTTIKDK